MKKHILSFVILLISLIVLNGCTLLTTYNISENNIDKEKEVFAVEETETSDDALAVKDESEEKDVPSGFPHKYTIESDEGEVLAPDGEVLATYSYSYPVFISNEGDDAEYVDSINKMFEENAVDTFVSKEEFEFLLDEYLRTKDNGWSWYGPFKHRYSFGIHTDAKGILSVTETWYDYTGGAHGNAAMKSHTFDVVNGKELALSDLLYGSDEEITNAFTEKFLEVEDMFFDDPSVVVPEELANAEYYADADGVTAYFQQYQVGPYAAGFVSATISDKEMLKYDFSDLIKEY